MQSYKLCLFIPSSDPAEHLEVRGEQGKFLPHFNLYQPNNQVFYAGVQQQL
jgi:hypothetical protein